MHNYGGLHQQMHKNQFWKLVALTDKAVTQDMSAVPQEKPKNILSNY